MNSSNSSYEPSGFRNSREMSGGYGFKSPAAGSNSGLSRPRFQKVRKQTVSHRPTSTPASERLKPDLGFDSFRIPAQNLMPIVDNMRNLEIASGPTFDANVSSGERSNKGVFVFGSGDVKSGAEDSGVSGLPDEMRKLGIGRPDNAGTNYKTQFGFGENATSAFASSSSVAHQLPNDMKKLNVEDPVDMKGGNVSGINVKDNFAFGTGDQGVLPEKMKGLNIRESGNSHGGGDKIGVDKNSFASGGFDRNAATSVLDEMEKFKIGSLAQDTPGQTQAGLPHRVVVDGIFTQNASHTKFHDVDYSIPVASSFQAGAQGKTLSDIQVPASDGRNDSTASSSSFASSGIHFQPVWISTNVPSMDGQKKNSGFLFNDEMNGIGSQNMEFRTPNPRGNLYSVFDRRSEAKKESAKDTRLKKKKGKLRKPTKGHVRLEDDFVLGERSSQENPDSFESYSPMDVSPYRETVAENSYSRETSVASDEPFHLDDKYASTDSCPTVGIDARYEDLAAATHRLDLNEGDFTPAETKVGSSENFTDVGVSTVGPSEESVSGAETESFKSAAEQLDYSTDTFVTAEDTEVNSNSTNDKQESDGSSNFRFMSNSEDMGRSSFTFGASSSNKGQFSADTRHHKKKNRLKVGHNVDNYTPNAEVPYASTSSQFFPLSGTSSLLPSRQGDVSKLLSGSRDRSEVKERAVKQGSASTPAASIAAQEACEKWRLRGNQAYAIGDLHKAEEYYTQGVKCVSQSETSRSCLRALMLCYSNRAATRMSLGRMREALKDCMEAVAFDPNFLRVQVRAANCYLALGEVENASVHFLKCLQSGNEACVDRKLLVEASEGLEKTQATIFHSAYYETNVKFSSRCFKDVDTMILQLFYCRLSQKVLEYLKQSAELLERQTCSDAECALEVIDKALIISSCSEKLREMKADALLMLRKYEQVIQLCSQSLHSAETSSLTVGVDSQPTVLDDSDLQKSLSFRRWCLIVKAYFNLGRLEDALEFLKKQEVSVLIMERNGSKTLESVIPLAGTIRELLRFKRAGNEAFKSGKHLEAVEYYTAALSCNVESRPFAAICFCNRAAAYRAMGQITDAIADCSLAIALDGNYVKAVSRRATLFEMIRDYGQATRDLERVVFLLTKQVEEKGSQSRASDKLNCVNELREVQLRLSVMEEEARKEIPLNMYLILGVEPSAAASEIKKAYRKAALKHHPDKAGQSLVKSENGDEGLWKDIAEEVQKETDRLFKMIGEAYTILSDSSKRARYDQEEERRNGHNRGNVSSTSRTQADAQNYPFERSSSRRQRQDWSSYGNFQPRGSERTRSENQKLQANSNHSRKQLAHGWMKVFNSLRGRLGTWYFKEWGISVEASIQSDGFNVIARGFVMVIIMMATGGTACEDFGSDLLVTMEVM
ncbi:hypothetical protein RJ639_043664 [Escallonia herrerae]|uniref:J domain-containing protein n=1 Tax=Escallonia herrerae TaxID=1293975 RepID=A0AA88WAW7_9ASTE|nr:hypothetical protein RJ639_043664 [Escallonia herrerae]